MSLSRSLCTGDIDSLARFLSGNRLPRETLCRELDQEDIYVWMGLFDRIDGELIAVHRGMDFGGVLLLKGVTVASNRKGSTAALQVALAITENARKSGRKGVAVWVEPSKPERHLAARLRIPATGPLVHRYQLPIGGIGAESNRPTDLRSSGMFSLRLGEDPLVPNLLPSEAFDRINWVLDNQRLLLSTNPCNHASQLPELLRTLAPLAQSVGARALEIHFPASDLISAVAVLSNGAKRLSRTPVRLGVRYF